MPIRRPYRRERGHAFQLRHGMVNRLMMTHSTVEMRRWAWPAIVTLAAMTALTALAADAAARQARPAPLKEATAPRDAGEPIMAIVSIKTQQVTFYDADGWILRAPVSTGIRGRETPAGVFAVIEKDKDHHSTLYDDAWMPNMQRITWNGIALHGGPLPGYAASHGCVRMPYGFAEKLFDKTWIGMRVIISPNDAEPVEFSLPALFVPNREAIAAAPARAETLAREATEAARTADEAKKAAATAAARDSIAHGVAAQAGMAQEERRRRACVRRQGARRRKDGPGQGPAGPHAHPPGCAPAHPAHRIAGNLGFWSGRAAKPRDQLSHRVRRGAEQPAPGRLRDAPAYGRYSRCGRQRLERQRLRLLFSAQSGAPTRQSAPAWRPVLLSGATGLASGAAGLVRRGTPRAGRMVAQGPGRVETFFVPQ